MKNTLANTCLAALASIIIATTAPASAQSQSAIIEDFESYSSGVGAWAIVDVNNVVSVNLQLGLNDPIEGLKDLRSILGVALPGGTYTIQNLDVSMTIPDDAEEFTFSMKSLVQLNIGRTVTITLRDQDNIDHVSPPIDLATLIISTAPTEISVKLSDFTPPLSGGNGTTLTGVSLQFDTLLAGIAGMEQLDSLRFMWDATPASATGWTLYE